MMLRKPWIISIAAVSGGGKTATTKELNNRLDQSKALYFDDYEFDECPEDICEWISRGADCNEWNLHPMIEDIELLQKEESINYIIIDFPFAYLHNRMREYIDLAVYIDTPLDIAMARRILRDYEESTIEEALQDAAHYLVEGRSAYLNMETTVKPCSDFVVDGTLPTSFIVDRILVEVASRLDKFNL